MGGFLRLCVLAAAVAWVGGCASTEYTVAQAATADGSVLRALSLSEGDVKFQSPCNVAVQAPRPIPLSCVYVQTADSIHFLRFNPGNSTYSPAVSLKISELTHVAMARFAINRQLQLNRKGELLAFQLVGANFVNTRLNDEVFASLTNAGVPAKEPEGWIALLPPQPVTITIPVYVGR